MAEDTAEAAPHVKLGEVHDLTSAYMPPFRFRIPELVNGELTGKNLDYAIAFEHVGMELQLSIPTALAPCGQFTGKPGKGRRELSGLEYSFKMFMDGKNDKIPHNLPGIKQIVKASIAAFELPEKCPEAVVMAVLGAYFQEGALRAGIKKGSPGSPDSSGSTRASSTPKPSSTRKSRG